MDFAISIDERPSAAICRTRRRLSGVNRTGRLAFFVMASPDLEPVFLAIDPSIACQNWRKGHCERRHILELSALIAKT